MSETVSQSDDEVVNQVPVGDDGASAGAAGSFSMGATGAASAEPEANAEEVAAAEKKAAARKDLLTRLATAALLIPFVLWAIAQGGLIYLGIVVGIGLLAQHEFYGLIVDKGAKPIEAVGLAFGAAVMLLAHFGTDYQAMLVMMAT